MNLYELARAHNGIVVWEFSQNKKEVNRWLGIGVCSALSASWVKYHAHNDSLANHLGSCGVGKLNTFTMMSMTHLQDCFINKKKGNVPTVKVWLNMHGLIPVRETYGETVYGDSGYHIITTLIKYYNCYAYFASGIPEDGHATAVWLGGFDYKTGDACFFEPNYGEIWFERKQDFFQFFPAYFLAEYKAAKKTFWDILICQLSNKSR